MADPGAPNPLGSLVFLGILLYIVYRILQTINGQNQEKDGSQDKPEGRVFHMPEKRVAEPPASITLRKVEVGDDKFSGESVADEAKEVLAEKSGLTLCGDFKVEEMPEFSLRIYTHPQKNLVGILYKDPGGRAWLNLLTEYRDGRIVTTSSAQEGAINTDRPRGMPLFQFPGFSVEQLLRRHKLETRGTDQADPVSEDGCAEFFNANYTRLRKYLAGNEETETTAKGSERGVLFKFPKSPPAMPEEEVHLDLPSISDEEEIPQPSGQQLRQWLNAIYNTVSVPKEKRSQFQKGLVWVLENANMASVADTILQYTDVSVTEVEKGRWVIRTSKGAEDIIEPGALNGPELFDKVNRSLPKSKRLFKLPVSERGVAFYSRIAPNP